MNIHHRLITSLVLLATSLLVVGASAVKSAEAQHQARQDPVFVRQIARLASGDIYSAFVHMDPSVQDAKAVLANLGLQIVERYESVDAFFVRGRVANFRALTREPAVNYLEANRELSFHDDTDGYASRARVAMESVLGGPYLDADGTPLSGSGQGVVVVDSGVFGEHPDLTGQMAGNWKIVCSTPLLADSSTERCFGPYEFVETPTSDTTAGHGTHVAGIIAGDGTQSNGFYRGVAPEAAIYGIGAGDGIHILHAAEAFDFIIENLGNEAVFPVPVVAVNNSWGDDGSGIAYDPDSLLAKLTREIVEAGVTVMFSAGNSAGSGSLDATSSTCDDPTPGVVCVANYDDLDTGTRTNALASTSSRGEFGNPETYPDLSAPGTSIGSTCMQHLALCSVPVAGTPTVAYAPWYSLLSGTSMASPHVAGAVALLKQARPDLTPAEIENVLQDTAFKFRFGYEPDPQNPPVPDDPETPEDESEPQGTTSFDKGAGLLDVKAALDELDVATSGEVPAGEFQLLATDSVDPVSTDVTSVGVQEEVEGLRYTVRLSNVTDQLPPPHTGRRFGAATFTLNQIIDGKQFVSRVNLSGFDASPFASPGTVTPESASFDRWTNTLSVFLSFSSLGDPEPGSLAHNVWLEVSAPTVSANDGTVFGTRIDVAPGEVTAQAGPVRVGLNGRGARDFSEPLPAFGLPFTITRAVELPMAEAPQ